MPPPPSQVPTRELDALPLEALLSDSSFTQESVTLPRHYETILAADAAGALLSAVLCVATYRLWRRRRDPSAGILLGWCVLALLEMVAAVWCDADFLMGRSVLPLFRVGFALAPPMLYGGVLFACSLERPMRRRGLLVVTGLVAALSGVLALTPFALRALVIEAGVFIRVYGDGWSAYTIAVAGLVLVPAVLYGIMAIRRAPLSRRDAVTLIVASSGPPLLSMLMGIVLPTMNLASLLFYTSTLLPLSLIAPYRLLRRREASSASGGGGALTA